MAPRGWRARSVAPGTGIAAPQDRGFGNGSELPARLSVRPPVDSGIAVSVYRQISQSVCRWNVRFAKELPHDSAFRPREVIGDKDARQLARELLCMTQSAFGAAFRGSPMKRAKLRGMRRNAAVVLGNVGTNEDVDVLTRALDDPEPLVREHAAWALARLADQQPASDVRAPAPSRNADTFKADTFPDANR